MKNQLFKESQALKKISIFNELQASNLLIKKYGSFLCSVFENMVWYLYLNTVKTLQDFTNLKLLSFKNI